MIDRDHALPLTPPRRGSIYYLPRPVSNECREPVQTNRATSHKQGSAALGDGSAQPHSRFRTRMGFAPAAKWIGK